MANRKIILGLLGIKSAAKIPFAKWVPMASLLILALTILYGSAASGGAEVSTPANQTNYVSFQSALGDQMHASSELPQETAEAPPESQGHRLLLALEIAVCMVLTFRLLIPKIAKLLDKRWNPVTTPEVKPKSDPVQKKAVANVVKRKSSAESGDKSKSTLDEFFKAAPDQLVAILKIFAQLSRSEDSTARQKFLEEIGTEVTSLKNRAGGLDLTPAWHVASNLEKLVNELREKPSHITSPTLRTTGNGLLLLKDLCTPGVRKDLVTEPPGRFLVVDDDPISGQAVSACLKKVAQTPDLAADGDAALKLAERQKYDAIFMDVELPGLDGFEVGAKIHELELNRTSPVIYVTSIENYESRTKSSSSRKTDLIAKPFLSSEITLKAITLLLRGRLDREKAESKSSEATSESSKSRPESTKSQIPNPNESPISKSQQAPSAETSSPGSQPEQRTNGQSSDVKTPNVKPEQAASEPKNEKADPVPAKPDDTNQSDAKQFAEHLRELQIQVSALNVTENTELRQELLSEIYVGINVIRSEAARTGLRGICEVSSALGKLVSKLLDNGSVEDTHKVEAIVSAIGLLEELSQGGVEPDLANPPIRALVVDEEPLARRAVSNALQLTIDKPDNAENGNAALALAQSKPFDVIFLDIMMPEMDGLCSKIRTTKFNAETPIIFVTSSKDTDSRDKALNCGGNGFITKPVLPAEIFLMALTSTLRARMKNSKGTASAEVLEEAIC